MSKFKYLKISKHKKLRLLYSNNNSKLFIVFLHGFMSDIEGDKPRNFLKYCNLKKINFLAVECSGHGKSSGKFENGNISKWTNDIKFSINNIVKKKKFILIGSSMGSWLSLNQFQYFKNQIIGFVGIGSAPEFLENLMWKKFSKKQKNEIRKNGLINLKHGNYEYPITHQIIKDGRKNKIFNKIFNFEIPVTMIHGLKDEVVPTSYSKKILKIFKSNKKKLVLIKKGDHSLSEIKFLRIINKEITKLLSITNVN